MPEGVLERVAVDSLGYSSTAGRHCLAISKLLAAREVFVSLMPLLRAHLETYGRIAWFLERSFDPDSVRDMKRSATGDLTLGGPNLAAHAFTGGLVDESDLFIDPVLVGGGKPALPSDTRAELELVDERRFTSGVVYLRYRNPT